MLTRAVLVIVLLVCAASGAFAGVLRVEQDGSGDFILIQDAVDAAASGDTILIGPGRYDDLQPRGVNNVVSVAYWADGRDLTFIGEDVSEVIIGPQTYVPSGTGPQGIHQHQYPGSDIVIENISFVNLLAGIVTGEGSLTVSNAQFETGKYGVFIQDDSPLQDPSSCEIRNCGFGDLEDFSVFTHGLASAEIIDCTLSNSVIYFNYTNNAHVRNCTVTGGSLVRYSLSRGVVEGCDAQCDGNVPCISVADSDTVKFYGNIISGGEPNMDVSGAVTNVFVDRNDFSWPSFSNFYFHNNASVFAHDNHINRSSGMINHIVYTSTYTNAYSRTIDMGSNYWFADGTLGRLDDLIWDHHDDGMLNIIVNYDPIRTEPVPTEKKSFGGLKAMYR